jgi:hypothetical protein
MLALLSRSSDTASVVVAGEKNTISCGRPSSSTVKSSVDRSLT